MNMSGACMTPRTSTTCTTMSSCMTTCNYSGTTLRKNYSSARKTPPILDTHLVTEMCEDVNSLTNNNVKEKAKEKKRIRSLFRFKSSDDRTPSPDTHSDTFGMARRSSSRLAGTAYDVSCSSSTIVASTTFLPTVQHISASPPHCNASLQMRGVQQQQPLPAPSREVISTAEKENLNNGTQQYRVVVESDRL